MGHEELYQCEVCAHMKSKYVFGTDKIRLGYYFYGKCENGCIYPDNAMCIMRGLTKFRRVR